MPNPPRRHGDALAAAHADLLLRVTAAQALLSQAVIRAEHPNHPGLTDKPTTAQLLATALGALRHLDSDPGGLAKRIRSTPDDAPIVADVEATTGLAWTTDDLSPGEQRAVEAVIRHGDLAEAGHSLAVTRNTVKSQMLNVARKLGVRQSPILVVEELRRRHWIEGTVTPIATLEGTP